MIFKGPLSVNRLDLLSNHRPAESSVEQLTADSTSVWMSWDRLETAA